MSIADNIKKIRLEANMTQEEFGDVAGVSPMAVSQWENGRAVPRMGAVQRIADYFNINKGTVIDADGEWYKTAGRFMFPVPSSAMVPLRVLGATHAGDATEEIPDERLVEVPESVARNHPDAFMLRVDGDCMNRSYPEGCLVMVDPSLEPWNGCAVVAEPEPGESVLRRYMRGQSSLMLVADSFSEHDDLVFTGDAADVRLVGTVVWFQAAGEEEQG